MEVSAQSSSVPASSQQEDPIVSFPTSDQPMSDTTMKSVLLSLRASLQAGLFFHVHKVSAEV